MTVGTYDVWIPPIWLSLVCSVILRLLRNATFLLMNTHSSKVNRIVDRIMSHHDDTDTLVSFLRSPDVVGIIKDYCGNRRHDSFLHTYGRICAIRSVKTRVHPDIENGIGRVPRYYQEPTTIEDITRRVIEADGVLTLLRFAISLITLVLIIYHFYLDTDVYGLLDAGVRAILRAFNSGILARMGNLSMMVLTVRHFKYPSLGCTPTLVLINIVYISCVICACAIYAIYLPYALIHFLLTIPTILAMDYIETLPYPGTDVSIYTKNHRGYHLYVLNAKLTMMTCIMYTTAITPGLPYIVNSLSGWWEYASYDFYRRVGFLAPMDAVSFFQFLTVAI